VVLRRSFEEDDLPPFYKIEEGYCWTEDHYERFCEDMTRRPVNRSITAESENEAQGISVLQYLS
jgi:hypothetical protein